MSRRAFVALLALLLLAVCLWGARAGLLDVDRPRPEPTSTTP